MQISKHNNDTSRVDISRGSEGSSPSKAPGVEPQKNTKRTKTLHPPIESHFQLPPLPMEQKPASSSSSSGFKSVFSYPLKLGQSLNKKIGRSKSMVLLLEGSHDPNDEQLVQSFRQLLFVDDLHLPHNNAKHNDYHTLLRFLRMRDFDFAKAKEMFFNYLKWREEYRVDAISKEFKFHEYDKVKQCYPHGYHGVDRYGRPVYIERIGMADVNELLKVTTVERFVKYHVSEQEKTLNFRYLACSVKAKKHVASTTSILDVQGVGLANFSRPARAIFMEIQKIDSNYYPETLHRLFIVNAGSGFKMLWKAVKAFLDARTLAKIHVLGHNYLNELLEVIDISDLPTFLGGNCTCADYGGCLFSDKGPWNNPDIAQIVQAISSTSDGNNGDEIEEMASEAAVARNLKMRALDTALAETKTKIEALEALLEETKIALEGLSVHIEELRSY